MTGHAKLHARRARPATAIQLYFVSASPAVIVTAVTSVAESHCRQTATVAEGLPGSRREEDNCKTEFGYFQ